MGQPKTSTLPHSSTPPRPSTPSPRREPPKPDAEPGSDKHLRENSQTALDGKLDDALEETFPSSDPVSVKITK